MYRLLIVEDEEIIRRGLKKQVPWQSLGFEVVGEAENGKTAMDLIPELLPNVVLTDVKMPVVNGIELMSALKASHPDIKVIVLSGYDEFEYAQKSIEYGAFSYILKPTKKNTIKEVFLKLRKELDDITAARIQLDDIRKTAQKRLYAVKEKIMADLLEGSSAGKTQCDIINDLKELGIDTAGTFGIITFKISSQKKCAKGISFFKAEFVNIIYESLVSFPDIRLLDVKLDENSSTLSVILQSPANISTRPLVLVSENVGEGIRGFMSRNASEHVFISAGIGKFYNSIFKLNDSYNEALCALSYRFYNGRESINHIEEEAANHNCIPYPEQELNTGIDDNLFKEIDNVKSNIISEISSLDINTVLNDTSRLFSAFRRYKIPDMNFIYSQIVELMILLSTKLSEKGINISNIFDEDIHSCIKNLTMNETIIELEDWFSCVLAKVASYIKYIDDQSQHRTHPAIDKAIRYLYENYNKKISLNDVAEYTFMSASYFCTFFKQYTGHTFTDFLSIIRIKKAKEHLQNPYMKIYEIAAMVGYDDWNYFSKIFKRITGISPVKYKELASKGENNNKEKM